MVFDSFVSLDGLIQVLYHSTSCFVLLSNIETAAWVVELGLVGDGNRWWRGSWSEKDVRKLVGSKASEDALEQFSDKLANYIIMGELSVGDWNPTQGKEIELQINPTDKAHVAINLVELPAVEGSVRAITLLKGIALQAQSHRCRINGGGLELPTPTVVASKPSGKSRQPPTKQVNKELQMAQDRIKRLEGEVSQARQAVIEKLDASPSKRTAPKPPPGASRANPTRQKRKIVQAEFESD